MTTTDPVDELRRDVAFRALQDAWLQGTRSFWLRRARDFEWVLTGDRSARPTVEQLAANPAVAATIAACRARADLRDLALVDLSDTLTDLAAGAAA